MVSAATHVVLVQITTLLQIGSQICCPQSGGVLNSTLAAGDAPHPTPHTPHPTPHGNKNNHSETMADLVAPHIELYAKKALHQSKFLSHRQFVSFFGVTPAIVASVWRKIRREGLLPDGGTPVHLLWSFAFLKTYGTEPQMAMLFHTTRKTFRQWVWRFVDAIFYLDVVSLLFCFCSGDSLLTLSSSVDTHGKQVHA